MAVFHPDIHGMSHGMCQLSVLVHWNTTTTTTTIYIHNKKFKGAYL